jgi:hypothetical protein
MKYATFILPLAVLALGGCAATVNGGALHSRGYVQTESVCTLTDHAVPPSGVRVRVAAFYITDYAERSRLADPSCPSGNVDFEFKQGAVGPRGGSAGKELESTILHDFVDNHRTGVYRINFTGRFVYRKSLDPHAMVDISRVWSFERLPCTAFYAAAECRGMD